MEYLLEANVKPAAFFVYVKHHDVKHHDVRHHDVRHHDVRHHDAAGIVNRHRRLPAAQ